MHPMLTIAVKAARRAGTIINRAARDVDQVTVTRKRHNDFVTEVDRGAETAIIDVIRASYPDHAILAEESGKSAGVRGGAEYTWIIDPLDGTTNFIHGFPQYAVSIGVMYRQTLTHGVIYDSFKNELFHASRGGGAYLNDKRIRVSKRTRLADGLIGTGFPYSNMDSLDHYLAMFRAVVSQVAGVRRAGAAALDLAYVAAGRLDGFWELGLSPWDIAAGIIIIQEAGGLVSDLHGESDYLNTGRIVGGNPKIFHQLLQVLSPLENTVGA
ncbi:MAG: inositol monophosphatase [Betaproteobacteria bacterium]|nr:inositol monophosphatase [Betaproteobacteria bacterium]